MNSDPSANHLGDKLDAKAILYVKNNQIEYHIYRYDEYQVRPLSRISLIYGMRGTDKLREREY